MNKATVKPFIPLEDEQGNKVENNPETEKSLDDIIAAKKSNIGDYKVFKTIYSGVTPIPVMIEDRKRYLQFNKHTYRTNYKDEQEALQDILEEDKSLPIQRRRVLSEDDFLEYTSPEKVYIEIDGQNLHITEIREAVKIAKKNGWKPTGKKVFVIPDTKSKISQGSRAASSGGI